MQVYSRQLVLNDTGCSGKKIFFPTIVLNLVPNGAFSVDPPVDP